MNLYHVDRWLIRPATFADNCSLTELLTCARQLPTWYVSHYWGELIVDFLRCLEVHTKVRALKEDSAYWVCAYANRQHALADDVAADPKDSSFYKALLLAKGLLLVLDDAANAFSRIWCAFEQSVALEDNNRATPMLMDIATCTESKAQLITDGIASIDHHHVFPSKSKVDRESKFPIEIFKKGLLTRLEKARASNDMDRVRILNCFAGQRLEQTPPLREHDNYTRTNVKLRAIFAVAAWRLATERGLVQEMQLPQTLAANKCMQTITLDFTGCNCFDYVNTAALAEGLPFGLEKCNLMLRGCGHLGDGNCATLAQGIPTSLKHLSINLSLCSRLGDRGVAALANALPQGLLSLNLVFWGCHLLGDPGVVTLASCFPNSLLDLRLNFHGCSKLTEAGVSAIASRLPTHLKVLKLYFSNCDQVGDAGTAALAARLPYSLEDVELRFEDCTRLSDKGIGSLARRLVHDRVRFSAKLAGTKVSDRVRTLASDWEKFRYWYNFEARFLAVPAPVATAAAVAAEAFQDDADPADLTDDTLTNLGPLAGRGEITLNKGLMQLTRLRRCASAPF
jgi:hypothetical protein